MPNTQVFPRDRYLEFAKTLFPPGTTIYWKGAPEPYFTPLDTYGGTPIIVKLDVGDSKGYGTNERRAEWVPEAQNGAGAWQYYNLQRMNWPLTIDVETYNSEHPGEDFLMVARNKIRWMSGIKAVQCMGLTTVAVGDVNSEIRRQDDHETFGAVLSISHGQCYYLPEEDNDGNVIDRVTSIPGTIYGGTPDPITLESGPVSST